MVPLVFGMLFGLASMGGLLAFEVWALFLRDGARAGFESVELVLLAFYFISAYLLRRALTDVSVRKPSRTARVSANLYLAGVALVTWYS